MAIEKEIKKSNRKEIPDDSLIIMVGVPGSGKSTLAKRLSLDEDDIVSTDKIRGEINGDEASQRNSNLVFREYYRRIREKLKNGQLVIADATTIKAFSRKELYDLAEKYQRPVRVIIMNIDIDECLKQNANRDRKVPEDVIRRMFAELKIEYSKIHEEVEQLSDGKVYDIIRPVKERYRDGRHILEEQIDLER